MKTEKIILDGKICEVVTEVDEEYKSMDYLDKEEDMDTMDLSTLKDDLEDTMEIINE